MSYPKSISDLIEDFARLPGVGKRTATRYVFYLLHQPNHFISQFTQHLNGLKQDVKTCSQCFNISSSDPCPICQDKKRNQEVLCVVSSVQHLQTIEKTKEYKGQYHVLGGTLNALEGITPDQLHIKALLSRLQKGSIKEVVLALNPDLAGESTSIYLTRVINALKGNTIKMTRLARGIPMGADLDYADAVTLSNALSKRQDL